MKNIRKLRVEIEHVKDLYIDTMRSLLNNQKDLSSVEFNDTIYIIVADKYDDDIKNKLLLSKGWLGECLKQLNQKSPYVKDEERKEIKDIKPKADTYSQNNADLSRFKTLKEDIDKSNLVTSISLLRKALNELIEDIIVLDKDESIKSLINREFAIARTNAYTYLVEARMILGYVLAEIKKLDDEKNND